MKKRKYKKLVVDGITYEYFITEKGTPCFKGIVTYGEMQKIKKELEKKGI